MKTKVRKTNICRKLSKSDIHPIFELEGGGGEVEEEER